MNLNPITGITSAVTGFLGKREDRKTAIATIKSAAAMAKGNNEHTVTMSDKQWELASKAQESGTWKDEFVTLVLYAPLIALIVGAFTTPDLSLFASAELAIDKINTLNTEAGYGKILWVVTLAALGLKWIKK